MSKKKLASFIVLLISILLLIGTMCYISASVYFYNYSNLIEISKNSAQENAQKIDEFLVRQFDVMLTVTESVEYLRTKQNISNEATRDYLEKFGKEYSKTYESYAGGQFIGIYGVFDGEYIDSRWIPPESFDPTTRPWYLKAISSDGSIIVGEPYNDAEDGDFIITLSKKLDDGSVMGMDIDVSHIKNTIGTKMGLDLVINGNQTVSGYSFLMTKEGVVTMHKEDSEISKVYSDVNSPMYGLYENVINLNNSYFEIKISGTNYSVFPIMLDNGWYYVTVIKVQELNESFLKFLRIVIVGTALVIFLSLSYVVVINRANAHSQKHALELSKALEDVKIDTLTGLYNRVGFNLRLDELKKNIGTSSDQSFAIVMMDINDLKYVNDNFGHKTGDIYILNCCNLMKSVFGEEVYRLGGDEFATILTGRLYENAEESYMQMLDYGKMSMEQPIGAENPSIAIGISYHEAGCEENIGDLVTRSDELMYANKAEIKKSKFEKTR